MVPDVLSTSITRPDADTLWTHDLDHGSLEEIATMTAFCAVHTPAIVLGDERILVQVVREGWG